MGAFLAPILVIIVLNVVIFICVIVVVIRHAREKAARIKRPISNKSIMRLVMSISGVLFLFGLSWLFFILTFSVPGLRETFQILFTVFNSLQGFFVFAFILFTEGFDYWKALLSCSKYKSRHIQPSLDAGISANKSKHSSTDPMLSTKENKTPEISPIQSVDITTSSLHQTAGTYIVWYQNNIAIIESQTQEMEENLADATPMKVYVLRYSTKKQMKSHMEEEETNLHSEDSSGSDEKESATYYTE